MAGRREVEDRRLQAVRHDRQQIVEVYRIVAARMLNKSIEAIDSADRQKGKATDLACGYGGSVGALRRIVGDDGRGDEVLQADVSLWRAAHPATRKLGREWLVQSASRSVSGRTVRSRSVAPTAAVRRVRRPHVKMTLPSGRTIHYPGARLVPNSKFEDGEADVSFSTTPDTSGSACAGGTARSLRTRFRGSRAIFSLPLCCAPRRVAGSTVFHCHDEIVIEAAEATLPMPRSGNAQGAAGVGGRPAA